MVKLQNSRMTSAQISKIVKDTLYEENNLLKKINSLLSRKDLVDLENDKMDALRMLTFHLESEKEMTTAQLVKFLKS